MSTRAKNLLLLLPLVLCSCGDSVETIEYDFLDGSSNKYHAYYSDAYFSGHAEQFDSRLATLSELACLNAFRYVSDEEPRETKAFADFYNAFGYSNHFFSPSYYAKPTEDSIAYGLASKNIGSGRTMVWGVVCSSDYGKEFISNCLLGPEGDATGFASAASQVYEGLTDYIVDQNITGNVSIYLCGYSRGAAVMNLVGGKLDQEIARGNTKIGNAILSFGNTYAYCMACPNATGNEDHGSASFGNIHNLLNFNDGVGRVPPQNWGLYRYGQDHYFPDLLTDIRYLSQREIYLRVMKEVTGEEHSYGELSWNSDADPAYVAYPSFAKYLNAGIATAQEAFIPTRALFAEKYQYAVGWMGYFFIMDSRSSYMVSTLTRNFLKLSKYQDDFQDALDLIKSEKYEEAKEKIIQICEEMKLDNGLFVDIVKLILENTSPLFELVSKGLNSEGADIGTLGSLGAIVFAFHLTTYFASWTVACNPQYGLCGDKDWYNDGTYYKLTVSPVADFDLSFDDGTSLFQAKEGKIVSSRLSAEIKDGALNLYLPKNASYSYIASGGSAISLFEDYPVAEAILLKSNMPSSGTI